MFITLLFKAFVKLVPKLSKYQSVNQTTNMQIKAVNFITDHIFKQDNDIEIWSIYYQGISVVVERFIRIIKTKSKFRYGILIKCKGYL